VAAEEPLYFAAQVHRQQLALAEEITQGRVRAHAKHGAQSIEGQNSGDRLLPILLEEVGEVARAMNEYALGNLTHEEAGRAIRAELVDVLTVASAWAVKFDQEDAERFPHRL
jgi:NTP pyrophosphatase (non-canonical NTP hydrolase)